MKEYESVIILRPTLTEQEVSETILRIEETIKKFGEITNKDDLSKRKLAYEIKKCKEGRYIVFEFKINNENSTEAVCEIERIYRITDEIIRFIIVNKYCDNDCVGRNKTSSLIYDIKEQYHVQSLDIGKLIEYIRNI